MDFARPHQIDQALNLLAQGSWKILSGGTDFYPALGERPLSGQVLDISALKELRGIEETGSVWRIGSLTTWSDIVSGDLPPAFDGLKSAAREVGSVQIQNRATVAGNLCNASPAADGVPPLLTLNASVELISVTGTRSVSLTDFITANRATVIRPDEMVSAITIPKSDAVGRSGFMKLGARKYLVISIAMVAIRIETDDAGIVTSAAVSVGACSEVAKRLPRLEQALTGKQLEIGLADGIGPKHFSELSPIDDVRAPANYRMDAALHLTRILVAHIAVTS